MPNWAYTQYKIKGSEDKVAALHKTIQNLADMDESLLPNGFGKLWLGNLVHALGGDWEKTYCRGHILDYSLENGILKINTETAWGEMSDVRHFIEQKYPSLQIFFQTEECGMCIFQTNDATGEIFPERWLLDWNDESEWELSYTKDENPWYIRAGAIIPMAPEHITSLQEPLGEFVVFVAPGDGKSEAFLYEDDGVSKAYEHDFARTRLEKTASERDVTVRIHARKGSYEGMSPLRKVRVVLDRVFPPTAVLVDGKEVPYSRFPAKETGPVWTYVGKNLALEVWLPEASADAPVVVECCFDPVLDQALLQGKKGLIQRMMRLTPEFKMELGRKDNLKSLPDEFVSVAQAGSIMTEYPSQVESALRAIDTGQMLLQLEKYGFPEKFMAKLAAQCQFADSGEHTGRP